MLQLFIEQRCPNGAMTLNPDPATIPQVVVGILQRCEGRLLEMTDMEKMVAFLRTEVPQWRHDALQVGFPAACLICLADPLHWRGKSMCRDCKQEILQDSQRRYAGSGSASSCLRGCGVLHRDLVCCLLRADGAMQELLTAALASEWTPKQALTLERTENVESVVDAVQRVASHLPQVQPFPGQLHVSDAGSYAGQAAEQKLKTCSGA